MFRNELDHMKIETHVLKVHINCQGCEKKVQKMLKKIEGVYSVNIYAEQQLVIVSGSVDSTTLIKKLVKSGKHADLWSAGSNNKLIQEQPNPINNNQMQYVSNGFNISQNQHNVPPAFLGPNIGIETVGGEMGQTLMSSARMHDDMESMMGPAAYQGSDVGYVGLNGHEINRFQDYAARTSPPSSWLLTNMGNVYHNYVSTDRDAQQHLHAILVDKP